MGSFQQIIAFFISLCLSIIGMIDNGGIVNNEKVTLTENRYYSGTDCFASGQGITTDGTYFYCTGSVTPLFFCGLTKIDVKTGKVVLKNEKAMPTELSKQGFNHLGGCTYFEGKLYVAIEDALRKHPCIGVFDAETLEFTGAYQVLGNEIQPEGNFPWCAADAENRLLYTGISRGCDFVNVFDIDTLEFIERIPLDISMYRTQGAEFNNGLLYVSCNNETSSKNIYVIDPATGHGELFMQRSTGSTVTESEGLTIIDSDDVMTIYQIDVIYPFGMAIRTYQYVD